ncbi:hypothetical protein BDM02DRAFT_3111453 [Thelephora ganbajun]|uniref:Uncharacterized protein n=1 Tax=Thelephora ganbajun TaxID=370292 RepID=A0ACB6ZMS1_THEGA|nr:hypothetical protein BDM02DRAFT_3111453 [Thelephora ganbajun]
MPYRLDLAPGCFCNEDTLQTLEIAGQFSGSTHLFTASGSHRHLSYKSGITWPGYRV